MILASFGTFDVKNYGDSLFPIIVDHELGPIFTEVIHVSPVGGQAYKDVPPSVSVKQFRDEQRKVDAVIVAGGNILHARRTPLPDYKSVHRTAYASLWAGAAKVAAQNNAPLIINSPGIPKQTGLLTGSIMQMVFRQAQYASVRDNQSLQNLSDNKSMARVVPDTALLLRDALGSKVQKGNTREIAVHVNDRYASSDLAQIASTLDKLSDALELRVHLIGIGACHGDNHLAKSISSHMTTDHSVTADPETVTEVAQIIASASLYVGSSLHGFITACSYGVPAIIVADDSQQHKFDGLLGQLFARRRIIPSWDLVLEEVISSSNAAEQESNIFKNSVNIEGCRTNIREHWQSITSVLSGPSAVTSDAIRYIPYPSRVVAASNIMEQIPGRVGARVRRIEIKR
ncbi:polysaccharide pyruvyl transferase family protein [Rhodococcus globerulus]|uniref:polysaccharide pyruvyl transferase family protein n=1 Tax=Rhodococcus globerulus TaxID=33008 RepID=UPI001C5A45B2|nr:polysaccharide pyruvyl transferase family protein [Rhodococcus globerulus]QXW04670.1 polysaccharide pyruvyl transferase family protein [Rhodococcus globerulus]